MCTIHYLDLLKQMKNNAPSLKGWQVRDPNEKIDAWNIVLEAFSEQHSPRKLV